MTTHSSSQINIFLKIILLLLLGFGPNHRAVAQNRWGMHVTDVTTEKDTAQSCCDSTIREWRQWEGSLSIEGLGVSELASINVEFPISKPKSIYQFSARFGVGGAAFSTVNETGTNGAFTILMGTNLCFGKPEFHLVAGVVPILAINANGSSEGKTARTGFLLATTLGQRFRVRKNWWIQPSVVFYPIKTHNMQNQSRWWPGLSIQRAFSKISMAKSN